MLTERDKRVLDGLLLSGARVSSTTVTLRLTDKEDAEWLYGQLDSVSHERHIDTADGRWLHREWYLELDDSPRYSLDNEDDFNWNRSTIHILEVQPTNQALQHIARWFQDGHLPTVPDDFVLRPMTGKVLYRARCFELPGEQAPYIEFRTHDFDDIGACFERIGVDIKQVNGMYRLSEEDSEIFRTHCGIDSPRPLTDTDDGGDE